MNRDTFFNQTNEFNVLLGETAKDGSNSRRVPGVLSVDLPEINMAATGYTTEYPVVRVWFCGVSDALEFAQDQENIVRVRAAEQYIVKGSGATVFKGREHIFIVDRRRMQLNFGTVKRGEISLACVALPVMEYTMLYEGEEVFSTRNIM